MIGRVHHRTVAARERLRELVPINRMHYRAAHLNKLRRSKIATERKLAIARPIVMAFLEFHAVHHRKRGFRFFAARHGSKHVHPALFELIELCFGNNFHVGNTLDRRNAAVVALVIWVAF